MDRLPEYDNTAPIVQDRTEPPESPLRTLLGYVGVVAYLCWIALLLMTQQNNNKGAVGEFLSAPYQAP